MDMNAVRKITVQTTETGTADATSKLVNLGKGYDDVSTKSIAAESASSKYEAALLRQQALFASAVAQQASYSKALVQQQALMSQQTAANDNASRSGETFGSVLTKIALTAAAAALGIGALYTAFKIAYELIVLVPRLIGEAWDLGAAKLKEYTDLANKAATLGVSTDFLQRITKAAEDAKLPVDALTAALTKMQEALAPKLGGSDAVQQIDKLMGFGNFAGNTGVTALKSATTPEEQFAAGIEFFKQASAASEKLAGLDVMKTIFGADVANNLAKDSDYLVKLQASAAAISKDDLVKQDDVDRAVALQLQYDAAVKILEQRWHPVQDLLTAAGINMHTAWVGIVSSIASAVDWATKLVEKLGAVPSWFQGMLNAGGSAITNLTTSPEGRKASEQSLGITSDPTEMATLSANQILASRLQNPANVIAARDQTTRLSEQLRPDKSKSAAPDPEETSAYDRTTESILKYIEVTKAASTAVDQAAGEQEKLKAIAQLTAAGIKDGLSPAAAAAKAEMSGLGDAAGAAADALAKAKVASQIDFANKTAFLTPQDVQIANELKTIYGNDVPAALASTEAAGLRAADSLKQISTVGQDVNRGFLVDFETGIRNGTSAWQSFQNAATNALGKIADKLASMAADNLWKAAFPSGNSGILGSLFGFNGAVNADGSIAGAIGPTSIGGAPLVGLHSGGIVGSEATFSRYVHPAYFDGAPRFHSGGIAGDEVPIIARKGEGVFTAGQMAAMGGGGGVQVNVNVDNSSGADVSVGQQKNSSGGVDLNIMVRKAVDNNIANGYHDKSMKARFGSTPVGQRR